jgi:hypothetical protein
MYFLTVLQARIKVGVNSVSGKGFCAWLIEICSLIVSVHGQYSVRQIGREGRGEGGGKEDLPLIQSPIRIPSFNLKDLISKYNNTRRES